MLLDELSDETKSKLRLIISQKESLEPEQLAKLHEVLAAINAGVLAANLDEKLKDRDGERARLLSDFAYFCKQAWGWVEDVPLQWNWHHDLLCRYLQALRSGRLPDGTEFRDLNANVPPGTSKSVFCSILWPAWCRAHDPTEKVMAISYSDKIVVRQSLREKGLIVSDWYQAFFPEVQLNPKVSQAGYWETTAGGWRFSGTRRQTATGLHPSLIFYDDLLSVDDAKNEKERNACNDWHDKTMTSRGAGEAIGRRRLNIQQRLHERDITGHLEKHGKWFTFCLPMEYEPNRMDDIGLGTDPRKEMGELLWPRMFPASVVSELKRALGDDYYGQYQQRPVASGGQVFKVKNLNLISRDEVPVAKLHRIKRGWDKAATLSGGCYTAGVLMGILEKEESHIEIYVMDVIRGQWDVTSVEAQIKLWATVDERRYGSDRYETVIEEEGGASGKQAAAETERALRGLRVRVISTSGRKKIVRYQPLAGAVKRYEVFVCTDNEWATEFIRELELIPKSEYKDQADSASLAYYELVNPGFYDLPDADADNGTAELMPDEMPCANKQCDRLARPDSPFCCDNCSDLDGSSSPMAARDELHETCCNHRHGELYRRSLWIPNNRI